MKILFSKGTEKQFEQIFREYYGLMMYIAMGILKDHDLAEDAVEEAYIKINRHLEKLKSVYCHQTKGYIVKVVRSISYDLYNKKERRRENIEESPEAVPDESINILENFINQESYNHLKEIIRTLPEKQRNVAQLFANGYSHEEIAQILGISRDSSKQCLHRARKTAQKLLRGEKNGK